MIFKKYVLIVSVFVISIIMSCSNNLANMSEIDGGNTRFLIPNNATIVSAELFIYSSSVSDVDPVVNLHRVTSPWEEMTVTWNNFGAAYDSLVIDSNIISGPGWYSFDIKPLIMGWIGNDYPMYGILLDQNRVSGYVWYSSRENIVLETRPYLKLVLEINGTILEEDPEELFADTYIWETNPDRNAGTNDLYTGMITLEKQTLINFNFVEDEDEVGTGTPGYWKNHPDAWPLDQIVIGGVLTYTKEEAIQRMSMPIKKDKWYTMFKAYVAAVLNVALGADSTPITDTLSLADLWLFNNPSVIFAKSAAWQDEGEILYTILDEYNNGLLGVPSRDDLEE